MTARAAGVFEAPAVGTKSAAAIVRARRAIERAYRVLMEILRDRSGGSFVARRENTARRFATSNAAIYSAATSPRDRSLTAHCGATSERHRRTQTLEENPAFPQTPISEIHGLEKTRKAVTQHFAWKESIQQQEKSATTHQDDRQQDPFHAVMHTQQIPFERLKEPREGPDQLPEAEIAQRRKNADQRGEQDQLNILKPVRRERRGLHSTRSLHGG